MQTKGNQLSSHIQNWVFTASGSKYYPFNFCTKHSDLEILQTQNSHWHFMPLLLQANAEGTAPVHLNCDNVRYQNC